MYADRVFINGNFITMKNEKDRTNSIAVRAGRIISCGDKVKDCIGKDTEIIDLKGYTVTPNFFDCHNHIIEGAKTFMQLNLRQCGSMDSLKEKLLEEYNKGSEWIVGIGWDEKIFEGKVLEHNILNTIIPDRPVYLIRSDGHCVWINTLAYEKLKSVGFSPVAKGSEVVEQGSHVGMFYEEDYDDAIDKFMYILPPEFFEKAILKVNDMLLKNGVTYVMDIMTTYPHLFKLYRKLTDEGKLKLRIRCGMRPHLKSEFLPLADLQDDSLKIGHVKYFLDGTFSSRTAMLLEPYEDDKANMGFQIIPDNELDSIVEDSLKKGYQISIHAIGDRAVNMILNSYERAYEKGLKNNTRNRIEHLQVIKESDIERLKEFNIVASFQPGFLYEKNMTLSRLGQRRMKDTYRYRSLIDNGVVMILDSDYPYGGDKYPDKVDGEAFIGFEPVLGIHAASSSIHMNQSEKISIYEALKAYTVNSAYVNFEENNLGTIEEGKFADMVVLSQDILNIDTEDTIKTDVIATIINGEIVYNKGI